MPKIFLVKKLFELLGFDQLLQKLFSDRRIERNGVDELFADLAADPVLFFLALNVAIFDPDLSAICLAKDLEYSPKRRGLFIVKPAGDEFAVKIPDRQAERFEIKFGGVVRRHVKRIDIGQQVTPDAVRVDQLQHVRLLFGLLGKSVAAEQGRVIIFGPSQRRNIDLEVGKDLIIEPVLPDEQLADLCKKQAAFGSLDHAVVVSARQRDDLADAELPRLRELLRRSGSSDKLVLVTSTGLCHTRITQPWGDPPAGR